MKTHVLRPLALIAAAVLALAACNKQSSPTPAPQYANLSGDYTGTVTDSSLGALTASGTLAQHGSSAGGSFTVGTGSSGLTAQLSLVVGASNGVNGSMVIDYAPPGPACTYSVTGTYTNNGTSSATLSGSYTAVTNCSGGHGTFAFTQQCTDTVAVSQSAMRRLGFPPNC